MAHNDYMTGTAEITIRINHTNDRRAFNERLAAVKEFDGRYNAADKTWTIPTTSIALKTLADYAEYKDMDPIAILTDHLRIGTRYELVEAK